VTRHHLSRVNDTPIALSEIDASCRLPLFLMFGQGAVWLVIGSASPHFHTHIPQPPSFANCASHLWPRAARILNSIFVRILSPSGLVSLCG